MKDDSVGPKASRKIKHESKTHRRGGERIHEGASERHGLEERAERCESCQNREPGKHRYEGGGKRLRLEVEDEGHRRGGSVVRHRHERCWGENLFEEHGRERIVDRHWRGQLSSERARGPRKTREL